MRMGMRAGVLVLAGVAACAAAHAQMPFYTDDTNVTDVGTLHMEYFNEYDALQSSQYPDLRQNTFNGKINFGLPHGLEFDVDAPYLTILRAKGSARETGLGDTDMGLKWAIRKAKGVRRGPALATSFYTEAPTGDESKELGSGLADYWLNWMMQEPLTEKTRVTVNLGYLFAGNTSTGVVGISTRRGHVYTGGISLVRDFTAKLSLGAEVYGGHADTSGLGREQLQGLGGGSYALTQRLAVTFALLGGRYEASPRLGGQVGFALDVPGLLKRR